MSDRKLGQSSARAALRLNHQLQIDALLASGLTRTQRVKRFAIAAEFDYVQYDDVVRRDRTAKKSATAAAICWQYGYAPQSIFSRLPGYCGCPVEMQLFFGGMPKAIPNDIKAKWNPTREVLEAFSKVQLKARFGPT
jgi:hypothetical protein